MSLLYVDIVNMNGNDSHNITYTVDLVLVVDDHSSSFRRLAALITTVDDFSLASTYYF